MKPNRDMPPRWGLGVFRRHFYKHVASTGLCVSGGVDSYKHVAPLGLRFALIDARPHRGGMFIEPITEREPKPHRGGMFIEPVTERESKPRRGDMFIEPITEREPKPRRGGMF